MHEYSQENKVTQATVANVKTLEHWNIANIHHQQNIHIMHSLHWNLGFNKNKALRMSK
jgi:hypothetical protein